MKEAMPDINAVKGLIELCRVGDEPISFSSPLSENIIQLGITHGLGAWCYCRCKEGVIKGVEEKQLSVWKSLYLQNSLKNQQKHRVFSLVQSIFQQENIPVIALKGIALASSYYNDEGTRPMGDIDILVPEGEGIRALELLIAAGAKENSIPRSRIHEQVHSHVRAIKFHGILVEVHQRLFSLGNRFHLPKMLYFEGLQNIDKNGVKLCLLNEVTMGYHLIAHAAAGIQMGGLRLGWLLDIALFWNASECINSFMDVVIQLNPGKKKDLMQVLEMSALFLPNDKKKEVISKSKEQACLKQIMELLECKDVERNYRLINLQEIMNTPGIIRKCKLLFKEFFPDKAYMLHQYSSMKNVSLLKLYWMRLVGRDKV